MQECCTNVLESYGYPTGGHSASAYTTALPPAITARMMLEGVFVHKCIIVHCFISSAICAMSCRQAEEAWHAFPCDKGHLRASTCRTQRHIYILGKVELYH